MTGYSDKTDFLNHLYIFHPHHTLFHDLFYHFFLNNYIFIIISKKSKSEFSSILKFELFSSVLSFAISI